MKILIVHPKDITTRFLCGIYDPIPDKTVITGSVTKDQLRKKIYEHDQILMLGHGSPAGLFSVGQFDTQDQYIIEGSMVSALRDKPNFYIWCNADRFVQRYHLTGLYSGMFISELYESQLYDFDVDWEVIKESNKRFAEIVSKHIREPLDTLYRKMLIEYGKLTVTNPIASFNFKRLYLSQPEPVVFPNNVKNI